MNPSPLQTLTEENSSLAHELNLAGGTYHRFVLPGDFVVKGQYDLSKFLDHYHIPLDLKGATVLDIGTASGYFAFECARRGADVTAIDIWDGILFRRLQRALGLSVRYVQKSIYDLSENWGKFDFVICGSLLLHLRDLVGAMAKIREVCAGTAIVSTLDCEEGRATGRPFCEFVGSRFSGPGGEYWTYWRTNGEALNRMALAVGFAKSVEVSRFVLTSEMGPNLAPHTVIHATVQSPGSLEKK